MGSRRRYGRQSNAWFFGLACTTAACGGTASPGSAPVDGATDADGWGYTDGTSPSGASDSLHSDADGATASGEVSSAYHDARTLAPPESLTALAFGPMTPFAEPLNDYIEAVEAKLCGACSFTHDIFDMAVFDGAMHLAYGDATVNVGRLVPVAFRSLATPHATVADVGPDSGEEQLDRFRLQGGRLLVAGIDATEDAWIGNVYAKSAGMPWEMHRNVPGGVHVHDIAEWNGNIFACGSGATPEEWGAGQVYAHLWVAELGLDAVQVLERSLNVEGGDARWTRMLPTPDALYVFGYKVNPAGVTYELPNVSWDGTSLTPLPNGHPWRTAFVTETDAPEPDVPALVRGVDITSQPASMRAWQLQAGDVAVVEALIGHTVVDAFWHAPTREWVLLTTEGDVYGAAPAGIARATIWAGSDLEALAPVLAVTPDAPVRSVAAWGGFVFVGLATGALWKAGDPARGEIADWR